MLRKNSQPVAHQKTRRVNRGILMSSGRAGKVVPVGFIPMYRGDSASGRVQVMFDLAEMPKPLLNAVRLNLQAWGVPHSALPQFASRSEAVSSYHGEQITTLGETRSPPDWFSVVNSTVGSGPSEIRKTLGLHWTGDTHGTLEDAYALIQNFRRKAHSNALPMLPYAAENESAAGKLAQSFWANSPFSAVVPDYEEELVVGSMQLDLVAGALPVEGLYREVGLPYESDVSVINSNANVNTIDGFRSNGDGAGHGMIGRSGPSRDGTGGAIVDLTAEMADQQIVTSLASIDKARELQSFAKLRTTYAGVGSDDYSMDDAIIADLMQGLGDSVKEVRRPFLLDSKVLTFGMTERYATDAANLDASISEGSAVGSLSINLPKMEEGGVIIITAEVVPERIFEAAGDPWLQMTEPADFPDALRDVLRPEPVDEVANWRVDARHTTPSGIYGFEPMNNAHNMEYTRLGGAFYQPDPNAPVTEQRSAIWMAEPVDPQFGTDHYLCPDPFPHDVFSDTQADAFEFTVRHDVTITGLTVIGDPLPEDTQDYAAIEARQEE